MSHKSQIIENLFLSINLLESSPPNLKTNGEVVAKIRQSIFLLQNGQIKLDNLVNKSKGIMQIFPNEVLLMILKNISTQQLLHLRLCCSRWKLLIESLLVRKQSLKLLCKGRLPDYWKKTMPVVGLMEPAQFDRMRLYSDGRSDDLMFNLNFRMQHCSVIARLFPQIQHLTVCLDYICTALPNLLSKMPQLISLSLYGSIEKGNSYQLFEAIYLLASLRNLDLMCTKGDWEYRIPFNQLEHFSFGGRYDQFDLVNKIGPKCTSLLINSPKWNENFVARIRANDAFGTMPINDQARYNITHFVATNVDRVKMESICMALVNLKYLNITAALSLDFGKALHEATKLKHLEQLRIFVATLESKLSTYYTVNVSTTVKTLKLGWTRRGYNFYVIKLGQTLSSLFPNLETIIFEHNDKPFETSGLFTSQLSQLKQCLVDCDKIEYLGRHKEWYLKNVLQQNIKCLKDDVENDIDTSSDNDEQ